MATSYTRLVAPGQGRYPWMRCIGRAYRSRAAAAWPSRWASISAAAGSRTVGLQDRRWTGLTSASRILRALFDQRDSCLVLPRRIRRLGCLLTAGDMHHTLCLITVRLSEDSGTGPKYDLGGNGTRQDNHATR